MESLKSIAGQSSRLASSTLAKQIYWLVGGNPVDDGDYHLLAPLYASSLAHAVYLTIDDDLYGDLAVAARTARENRHEHDGVSKSYPSLALQKLGGSNQQNVSQLNKARQGKNYLLGSLPPQWQSQPIKEPWLVESVFPWLGRDKDIRIELAALRTFLEDNPPDNKNTRKRRERHIDAVIDAMVTHALALQTGLEPSWSSDPRCRLVESERLWLDPVRAESDAAFRAAWERMDWPDDIGGRFGNWLNEALGKGLAMGDPEQRQWRRELLLDESEHGWAQQLHTLRHNLDAPRTIPTRRPSP